MFGSEHGSQALLASLVIARFTDPVGIAVRQRAAPRGL